MSNFSGDERLSKRCKLQSDDEETQSEDNCPTDNKSLPYSLTRAISPPPLRRKQKSESRAPQVIKSPFQLTRIQNLPETSNQDTVSLKDLIGDPNITECWEFNYLHDLDFLMDAFHKDARDLIKVHVVHGFWKSEDTSRLRLIVCPSHLSLWAILKS